MITVSYNEPLRNKNKRGCLVEQMQYWKTLRLRGMWTFRHLSVDALFLLLYRPKWPSDIETSSVKPVLIFLLLFFYAELENNYSFQFFPNKSLWPFFHLMQHVAGSMQQLLQPIKSVVGRSMYMLRLMELATRWCHFTQQNIVTGIVTGIVCIQMILSLNSIYTVVELCFVLYSVWQLSISHHVMLRNC